VGQVILKPMRLLDRRPISFSTAGSGVAVSLICRPLRAISICKLMLKSQVRDERFETPTNPAAWPALASMGPENTPAPELVSCPDTHGRGAVVTEGDRLAAATPDGAAQPAVNLGCDERGRRQPVSPMESSLGTATSAG
jgi:hypothetical protein